MLQGRAGRLVLGAAPVLRQAEHIVVGGVAHQVVAVNEPVLAVRIELGDGVAIVLEVVAARVAVEQEELRVRLEALAEADLVEGSLKRDVGRRLPFAGAPLVERLGKREGPYAREVFPGLGLQVRIVGTLPGLAAPPGDLLEPPEHVGVLVVPDRPVEVARVDAAPVAAVAEARRVAGIVAEADGVVAQHLHRAALEVRVVALGERVRHSVTGNR